MPSAKILAKKKKVVKNLSEELQTAASLVFTDYKGLTVAQDTEMRAAFRKAGVTYRVIKNSVSSRAFDALGVQGLDEVLKGPTAIAFATDDVVVAPRLVKEFVEKFKKMEVKGGVMEGAFVGVDVVKELASIPTLDVLYTRLVSTLIYPITKLAITLNLAAEKLAEGGEVAETTEEATDAPAEAVVEEVATEPAAEEAAEPVVEEVTTDEESKA